jgi:hypothetical protein
VSGEESFSNAAFLLFENDNGCEEMPLLVVVNSFPDTMWWLFFRVCGGTFGPARDFLLMTRIGHGLIFAMSTRKSRITRRDPDAKVPTNRRRSMFRLGLVSITNDEFGLTRATSTHVSGTTLKRNGAISIISTKTTRTSYNHHPTYRYHPHQDTCRRQV